MARIVGYIGGRQERREEERIVKLKVIKIMVKITLLKMLTTIIIIEEEVKKKKPNHKPKNNFITAAGCQALLYRSVKIDTRPE